MIGNMQRPVGLTGNVSAYPSTPSLAPVMGRWRSNDEIERDAAAQIEARAEALRRQHAPVITSLAGYFRTLWDAARRHKEREIEPRLLACMLARKGEYSSSQLEAIRQEGSPNIFLMLTDEKCTNLESWLFDIFDQTGELPFGLEETPAPELDPQLQDELRAKAQGFVDDSAVRLLQGEILAGKIQDEWQGNQRLKELQQELMTDIEDDLKEIVDDEAAKQREKLLTDVKDAAEESGWRDAFLDSIVDFATYPNSFLKGPFAVKETVLEWSDEEGRPIPVRKVIRKWSAPSPWDIFPGPDNRSVQDGYLIERHYLSTKTLNDLIGVAGYDDGAIRNVIRDVGTGGITDQWTKSSMDNERNRLEGREEIYSSSPEKLIPALQIWADVPGYRLYEYGLTKEQVPDATKHYPIEAWLVGGYVIKCQINDAPDGRRPYYSAGFREVKGSFWQRGLPEVIADCQAECNVAARALARNMSIASGPQAGVDVGAIPSGENIEDIYPMKIWQFDLSRYMGGGSAGKQPLWFFQPQLLAVELLRVYEFWNGEADNKSGVPRYATGGTGGQTGALGTASGMSMMLSNATKAIKRVAKNIDRKQVEPSIDRLKLDILLGSPGKYRGDVKIMARGSVALLHKETLQVRRNEAMQMVLNPVVMQSIGEEGFMEVLRQYMDGLEFKGVVPSKREVMMRQKEAEAQQAALAMASTPEQQQVALPRETNPDGSVSGDANIVQGMA